MDWNEVGVIGQVLGSTAVFVTLVYLSLQTRHARDEVRRSVSFTRGQMNRELFHSWASDERLLAIRIKSQVALGAPPPGPFVVLLMARGAEREQLHISLRRLYGSFEPSRTWYENTKAVLNRDAVRYIDNVLAQPG